MYENENRDNRENMEAKGTQESNVNWTTPAGQGGNQETGWRFAQNSSSQPGNAPYREQQTYQGYGPQNQRGPEQPVNRKRRGGLARKAAGITAAAVLFGTVSGGVMTGVNYIGTRLTGTYNAATQAAEAQTQAQSVQAVPAVNAQNSGSQTTTCLLYTSPSPRDA